MTEDSSRTSVSSKRVVKGIFGLLGIGILLPWNAFISAKPYFQARLCSGAGGISGNVELWFGLIYNLSSVLSLAIIILLQWRRDRKTSAATYESSSVLEPSVQSNADEENDARTWRMIIVPLSAYLVVFLLTTLLVLFPSVNVAFFMSFTLIGLLLCGVCTAFASAGIVGTAGLFPANIGINPYFSGQAVGGVAVSLANFIAAALGDPRPFRETYCSSQRSLQDVDGAACVPYHKIDWASFSYFLLGSVVLATCIAGYHYIDQFQKMEARTSYESLVESVGEQVGTLFASERGIIELHDHAGSIGLGGSTISSSKSCDAEPHEHVSTVSSVLNAVKAPAFCIFMTFFVTLSLFPGWTSQLQSAHECTTRFRIANDLYTPLTFLIFNAGDLTGRILSGYVQLDRIQNVSGKLVSLSLARLVFFPLLLFCVARDSVYVQMAFRSDLFSLLVQAAFGVGNGMLTTLSFMYAPTLIPAIAQTQTRASEILNLALSVGLLCGSIFSFLFSRVAMGHW
jgi:equilibrative nucleoside transporter 1/2/3